MTFSSKELEGEGEELAFAEDELACSALGKIALQTGVFPRKFQFVIWHSPKLYVIAMGVSAAEICTNLRYVLCGGERGAGRRVFLGPSLLVSVVRSASV